VVEVLSIIPSLTQKEHRKGWQSVSSGRALPSKHDALSPKPPKKKKKKDSKGNNNKPDIEIK
jgi:hypothetical protein